MRQRKEADGKVLSTQIMLKSLYIQNAAVISRLELEPSPRFTVITGETGSGKSVIVDCLAFLLGNRADRELVRNGCDKCVVSACFSDIDPSASDELSAMGIDADEGEIIIERTLSADGKTSARINGRPVTRQILTDAGRLLVSLHSQNDTATLSGEKSRLALLDSASGNSGLYDAYKAVYSQWAETCARLSSLKKNESEREQLRDILSFRIKEISSAKLKPHEDEELEDEKRRIEGSEKLRKCTGNALRAIYENEKGITASYLADKAADSLEKLSSLYPEFTDLVSRLRDCRYELDDIASEISALSGRFDAGENPEKRLDEIGSRLEVISKLKRKYGSDIDSVLKFLADSEEKFNEIENSDALIEETEKILKSLRRELDGAAGKLSAARRETADEIVGAVRDTLEYLDMPKVRFDISITPSDTPGPDGCDRIDFLLAANPGEPMLPLEKCASGGELSRVMLALRCSINAKVGSGTLLFDEIDTGISGKTSRKIGLKLLEASKTSQIICVTHSAQIASLSDWHLKISKSECDGRTQSRVERLDRQGRIDEVSRILGGLTVSEAQRQAAVDMIDNIS